VVLAGLFLSLTLGYGVVCALVMQGGYAAAALRREIEDLRADAALLEYYIRHAESSQRVEQTAARIGMRVADPAAEVDYVVLPAGEREAREVALGEAQRGVATALAAMAAEVVAVRGRAEASGVSAATGSLEPDRRP